MFRPALLIINLNVQEGEDMWDDDCSVSESSSICGPHRPNTHIREFNNPHYNDGDSGSNPDGRYLRIFACRVHSLIIMIFFGGTASDPIISKLFFLVQKTLKITARKFDVLTMGT